MGPRVIGRYTIFGAIASGGMATVYFGRLAGAAGFARTVAVKQLNTDSISVPELASSLVDEARLTSRIRHTNVVPTLDVVTDSGELFLVMDYVEGETLARLARAQGHVPPAIACAIIAGVLRGLHAAHEAKSERGKPLGIVHRDVSPQNVLVGVDGVARIADFGIAMAASRISSTRRGSVKGKLAYLSPEQVAGEAADRRSDVFAASVVLWEILTGARLHSGEDMLATAKAIRDTSPASPSAVRKLADPTDDTISGALDAVVAKGLARRREERFASAAEMADALEAASPTASAGEVGAWVRKNAAAALDAHRASLEEVEALSGVLPALPNPPPPDVEAPVRVDPPPQAVAPPRHRWSRILVVAGIVGIAAILTTVARRDERAPLAASAPVDPPLPLRSAMASAEPVAAPPRVAPPSVDEAPSAPASEAAPLPRARSKPATSNAKIDCTTLFIVDSTGIKIPRRECLPP